MQNDEPRFDIEDASELAGITPKRWSALARAGAPLSKAKHVHGGRYVEDDIRAIAVVQAIALEFDLKPREAVAYWRDLTPDGTWPSGSRHILFSIDGEPVAGIYPGAIAARIARRVLAKDVADHHESLRLAGVARSSSVDLGYSGDARAARTGQVSQSRQTTTLVTIPSNVFHPARLRAPIKEST